MCGLFGMAGSGVTSHDLVILKQLSKISILRGEHGTGFAYGNSHRSTYNIIKHPNDACYFDWVIKDHEEKDLYDIFNNFFIGHTRYATTGKLNFECTQPFEVGNTVGVHNGTVHGDYSGFATDSEMLLSSIDEMGLRKVLESGLLYNVDAMALVWYDVVSKKLHFYRNDYRSLFFAVNLKRDVLYWGSEWRLLQAILERNGVEANYLDVTEGTEFIVNPAKAVQNGKGRWSAFKHDVKTRELPKKETKNGTNTYSNNSNSPFHAGVDV